MNLNISIPNILVVVAGPTGIGKTKTTAKLAKHFRSEVVSFDSRQVYKEMKIGTAFPAAEDQLRVPHHMLAIKSIHDYYNASIFENQVIELFDRLFQKHELIFFTGGTGFYLDATIKGIDDLPTIDPELRNSLRKKYESQGIESIRLQLKKLDPVYYQNADLKNPNRILKALEISIMTGKPYSTFLSAPKKQRNFDPLLIGLDMDRQELYNRINNRVEKMMEEGLMEEAKALFPYKNKNALNTVGYKELFRHFDGEITLDEAIDLIKRNTRKYARRQLTWFRKYKQIKWFHPEEMNEIIDFVNSRIAVMRNGMKT